MVARWVVHPLVHHLPDVELVPDSLGFPPVCSVRLGGPVGRAVAASHLPELPDLRLRALCERRAQRWGDEWWSTEQVAQYHGCGSKAVVHQIRRGKLPGVQRALGAHEKYTGRKWKVWYVLRSDAMATKALYFKKLTPAALDYVRRARADGDVWRVINKKMKLPAGHEALRNYSRQHGIK